jgi:hypothetical protein
MQSYLAYSGMNMYVLLIQMSVSRLLTDICISKLSRGCTNVSIYYFLDSVYAFFSSFGEK